MGSGNLNSGPHSCAASSLFARPLPQPEEETFTGLNNGHLICREMKGTLPITVKNLRSRGYKWESRVSIKYDS